MWIACVRKIQCVCKDSIQFLDHFWLGQIGNFGFLVKNMDTYQNFVFWRNDFRSKCKRISRFDQLSCFKNSFFVFRSVETPLTRTRTRAIDSSCKAVAVTAWNFVIPQGYLRLFTNIGNVRLTYSFKHLLFLQLQRLQPSPLLSVFFLKKKMKLVYKRVDESMKKYLFFLGFGLSA